MNLQQTSLFLLQWTLIQWVHIIQGSTPSIHPSIMLGRKCWMLLWQPRKSTLTCTLLIGDEGSFIRGWWSSLDRRADSSLITTTTKALWTNQKREWVWPAGGRRGLELWLKVGRYLMHFSMLQWVSKYRAKLARVVVTCNVLQVSIFMTHMTNYAKDRLAPFLFQTLFQFVTRWTKLELQTEHPLNLGKKYFNLFPEDKLPLWTVSCFDKNYWSLLWPIP